jgi:hypothetical protein
MIAIRQLGLLLSILTAFQSCYSDNETKEIASNVDTVEVDKLKFIDYEKAISELMASNNIDSLEKRYDIVYVLLLDSSEIKLVESTNIDLVKEFRSFSSGLIPNKQTVTIGVDKSSIREVFSDKILSKKIIKSITKDNPSIASINQTIYTKGNLAIFETFGPKWSNTYYAKLENGEVKINWLGGIIE